MVGVSTIVGGGIDHELITNCDPRRRDEDILDDFRPLFIEGPIWSSAILVRGD
jgi:hypothetical protein